MQSTYRILMIRPASFGLNTETAVNNYYQNREMLSAFENAQLRAINEFDGLANLLIENGVEVTVVNDSTEPPKPDSLFPNNWISFHDKSRIVIYPMFAENRRKERRLDVIRSLIMQPEILDFTNAESQEQFLEGTGSLVLDRINRIAYAAISPRTNESLVIDWCGKMDYKPIIFRAYQTVDGQRLPVYHTNVVMCVGSEFAVICDECIDDVQERDRVLKSLNQSSKTLIQISEIQMNAFAGNMLEVKNKMGETFIVMSDSAFNSLLEEQKLSLEKFGKILHAPLNCIESLGGGSARCMLAEVFGVTD